MQHRAGGRDEERCRDLLAIEHAEDPRQAVDGAVFAAREDLVIEIAGRQRRGGVVDVERQADGDLRAVRPRALQSLAGADVKHLRLQLIDRELRAGQRIGPRLPAAAAGVSGDCAHAVRATARATARMWRIIRAVYSRQPRREGQAVNVTTSFADLRR